ncbi:cation diffusion facilitator family transporter [Rhizobacter fulvus]
MAESRMVIYGAIAANVSIAITKFVVAGLTGSSAMLSEGIHSAVDTGNGVLLLVGSKLSERPASEQHPFGHGKELYFWSLIFGIGGGVSFYEGIVHIRDPVPLEDPMWSYIVLGAAAVFEGASFGVALHHFLKESRGRPFWTALHGSKDPTTYTVLAEDAAALLGLAVAALGVFASHRWNMPVLDGVASLVIGLLLAGVAVLLVRESRGLLIGEGIRPETSAEVRRIVRAQPSVKAVSGPLSMYIGRAEVLLVLDVEFADGTPAQRVAETVATIERQVRERFPVIRRIYIEARKLSPQEPAALARTDDADCDG